MDIYVNSLKNKYRNVKTGLGLVLKIDINEKIPFGFRPMILEEGQYVKS
jgi:hypothetical protein